MRDKVEISEDEKIIQIIFNKNINYEVYKDKTSNQLIINLQKQ